jgi:glycerol-3-phosphate acyltransferase PlsY
VEVLYSLLSAVAAFWLGACPFSLWIGRRLAARDIRNYGDGNPGATNVFRASGARLGILALILDIGKGTPFVALAHLFLKLPDPAVLAIGLCAILGNAYSPLLGMKGSKALAVTGGVLLALPNIDIFVVMVIMVLLGFLILESHAWTVMCGPVGTLIYLLVTRGISWEALFMLCVILLWFAKQFDDLRSAPKIKVKPVYWLRAKRAAQANSHCQEL